MKRILQVTDILLIVVLTVYAILFCVPHFFGVSPVQVLSGSMEPTVKTGSIAYIKKVTFNEIEEGDIISFELQNHEIVMHRVKDINKEKEITTKGDANKNEDFGIVTADQLRGKMVFQIPYAGIVYQYLTMPAAIISLIVYLVISIGAKVIMGMRGKKEESFEDLRI